MEWERARTEEQKELRIAEILAATERLYDKYEFEEITFVLIAEEANFTRSNLYKYFNSKEEIFLEFVQYDIKKYVKSLVKSFRFNKDYSVDEFVSIWVKTLVKHKRLLDLIGILFSSLERNCSEEGGVISLPWQSPTFASPRFSNERRVSSAVSIDPYGQRGRLLDPRILDFNSKFISK